MTIQVQQCPFHEKIHLIFSRKRQMALLAEISTLKDIKKNTTDKKKKKTKVQSIVDGIQLHQLYRKGNKQVTDIVFLDESTQVIAGNQVILKSKNGGILTLMEVDHKTNPVVKLLTNGKHIIVETLNDFRIYQYDNQHGNVTFIGSHGDRKKNLIEHPLQHEETLKNLKKEKDPKAVKHFLDNYEAQREYKSCCAITKQYMAYITTSGKLATIDFPFSRTEKTDIGEGHNNLTIDPSGTYLATSSENGRIITLFFRNGEKICELRRGTSDVIMHDLCFSSDASMLACYSSSGTIHMFNTGIYEKKKERSNAYSMLYYFSYLGIDYFKSEWSMARFTTPYQQGGQLFFEKDTMDVHLVTNDGHHMVVDFSKSTPTSLKSEHLDSLMMNKLSMNHTQQSQKCYFLLKEPFINPTGLFWEYNLLALSWTSTMGSLLEELPKEAALFVNEKELTKDYENMTCQAFFDHFPEAKGDPYHELTILEKKWYS